MKIKILIPLIFCSTIVLSQNEIESVLGQQFQVIQIEGFDDKLFVHRRHDLESIKTFKDPLWVGIYYKEFMINRTNKEYKFSIGFKIVKCKYVCYNLNGEKLEPCICLYNITYELPIVPKRVKYFDIFFTDLLRRMERIEITKATITLSNSSGENIVLKR